MQIKQIALLASLVLLSACEDNNAKQCADLQNDENKRPLALSFCEQAAQEGDASAQLFFAKEKLAQGERKQAVELLEKSANQKNAEAVFLLGELHSEDKNVEIARFYYQLSCDLNFLKGCERISVLNNQDRGKQQNSRAETEAALEAKKVAEQKAKAAEQQAREAEQKALEAEKQRMEAEKQRLEAERKRLEAEKQSQNQTVLDHSTRNKVETSGLDFQENLAKFQQGNLWGFVDRQGNIVIQPRFYGAGGFYNGRAVVQTANQKWGYIDKQGNWIVHAQYCMAGRFSEGLAGVYVGGYGSGDNCYGGKWGFIDTAGNFVVSPVLDEATRFNKGKAKVTYQGHVGYINRNAQWVD